MKVLVIGSGGREHALAWSIAQSDDCDALYCAPGNPGISECAECVDLAADDLDGIVRFAGAEKIDLVVIGPEAPLVAGLADRLRAAGIAAFGPSARAAQLEGSKAFMKDFCARHNIPTAAYGRFDSFAEAEAFIRNADLPIVVKADGLAAGKGVVIAETIDAALNAARTMLSGDAFGDAGMTIVVEEFLDGEELSYFAIADGHTVLPLTSAQDHKRVGEGDTGPNTGGMGAYSPAHLMTKSLEKEIIRTIIDPTIKGMAAEGNQFSGILFAGIMVVDGRPVLLEFNTRFGDPECQAIPARMDGDLLPLLYAAATEDLQSRRHLIHWREGIVSLCVVMAAQGYPQAPRTGTVIGNLDRAGWMNGVQIFHAGTALSDSGDIVAAGGRVLGVTGSGKTIEAARNKAYAAIDVLDWPGGFCRRDIGWRAMDRTTKAG